VGKLRPLLTTHQQRPPDLPRAGRLQTGVGNGAFLLRRAAGRQRDDQSLALQDQLGLAACPAGDVGVVTAADARTGQRVWQQRVGGVFTASPVAADGKIYLLSEGGETVVLAAGRAPRILSRNKLDARQLASPAISGGQLFIRTDDALFAVGSND